MSFPRELTAKFFAVVFIDGSPKLSFHFKDHEGHLLVSVDENMLELMAAELIKAKKALHKSAEIPAA